MPTLTWLDRDKHLKLAGEAPYRLLESVPELSFGDQNAGNMLIQGDNLEALKALLPYFAGQVKCVYIDPPYNTRSAFEHYDDSLEHSAWLGMIVPRLEMLSRFLREDGSIWVSIDDNEGHYLKVIMDEVFGRQNFVGNVVWQKKYAPANDAIWFSDNHDHVLVYARNKVIWRPNKLPRSERSNAAYKNPDNDPRGPWKPGDYTCAKNSDERPNLYYAIRQPVTGEEIWPKRTRVWGYGQEEHLRHVDDARLWWGLEGTNKVPAYKRFLSDVVDDGTVPQTIWLWGDVGHTQDGRKEQIALETGRPFATPKPEKLLEQIIRIATRPDEIVLDSFLGSGTTAAVAQKLGRRYIGVEEGEHAVTHCAPRLQKVIEGERGGISESLSWQGGGGFRFFRLGPVVLNSVGRISEPVRFQHLAAHVWFCETGQPFDRNGRSPRLGVFEGRAIYLLFNGILGDRSADGGNVLTAKILASLPRHDGPKLIFGERSMLGEARLRREGIEFRQIPYEIPVR